MSEELFSELIISDCAAAKHEKNHTLEINVNGYNTKVSNGRQVFSLG